MQQVKQFSTLYSDIHPTILVAAILSVFTGVPLKFSYKIFFSVSVGIFALGDDMHGTQNNP